MDDLKSPPTGGLPPNLPVDNNPIPNSTPVPPPPPIFTPTSIPKTSPSLPVQTSTSIPTPPTQSSDSALLAVPKISPLPTPRSSIRTMEGDIKSAQAGQAPKSMEVKPPAFLIEPPKSLPLPPSADGSKLPASLTLPLVGVRPGEAEKKATPLPPPPSPEKLPLLKPVPKVAPLSTSGPGQGIISVPPRPSIFVNKRLLIIAGAGVLVLLGGILFLRGGQETEEVSSPTATPSVSPRTSDLEGLPTTSTLSSIFRDYSSLYIPADSQDELTGLQSEAVLLSNNSFEQNVLVAVKNQNVNDANLTSLKFDDFLTRFLISFPANLASYVKNDDFSLILTKQTEFFDQAGKLVASPSAELLLKPKMALAVRVIDALETKNQLTFWEDTLTDGLKEFYDLSSQFGDGHFVDGTYRGVPIRFVNLIYPDRAIDYAIVTAKNGNDYLIIANSRQQMFSIIDKLLGF